LRAGKLDRELRPFARGASHRHNAPAHPGERAADREPEPVPPPQGGVDGFGRQVCTTVGKDLLASRSARRLLEAGQERPSILRRENGLEKRVVLLSALQGAHEHHVEPGRTDQEAQTLAQSLQNPLPRHHDGLLRAFARRLLDQAPGEGPDLGQVSPQGSAPGCVLRFTRASE